MYQKNTLIARCYCAIHDHFFYRCFESRLVQSTDSPTESTWGPTESTWGPTESTWGPTEVTTSQPETTTTGYGNCPSKFNNKIYYKNYSRS